MHRSAQVYQFVPVPLDELDIDIRERDWSKFVGNRESPGEVELSLPEFFEPWTQIEAEQSRQCHREVGVAMRVYGQLGGLDALLAHHAFDRGTGLAFVQHDRLSVEDSPAVMNVGIDSHRGRLAPRVKPCLPDALAGFQAHHVRRGEIGAAPGRGDGVAMHELQHRRAGLGQTALVTGPAHGLAHRCGGELRDHAGGLGG